MNGNIELNIYCWFLFGNRISGALITRRWWTPTVGEWWLSANTPEWPEWSTSCTDWDSGCWPSATTPLSWWKTHFLINFTLKLLGYVQLKRLECQFWFLKSGIFEKSAAKFKLTRQILWPGIQRDFSLLDQFKFDWIVFFFIKLNNWFSIGFLSPVLGLD